MLQVGITLHFIDMDGKDSLFFSFAPFFFKYIFLILLFAYLNDLKFFLIVLAMNIVVNLCYLKLPRCL